MFSTVNAGPDQDVKGGDGFQKSKGYKNIQELMDFSDAEKGKPRKTKKKK
jgi:hypothetical protein